MGYLRWPQLQIYCPAVGLDVLIWGFELQAPWIREQVSVASRAEGLLLQVF